jgi:hypothetical protein
MEIQTHSKPDLSAELIELIFSDELWWAIPPLTAAGFLKYMCIPLYTMPDWKPYVIVGMDLDRRKEVARSYKLVRPLWRAEYRHVSLEFRRQRRWVESTRILRSE